MKRSLIYLFVAIAVAGVLGTLIARDPGYVLVSYGDMSIQTGLWVMLAILVVVAIAVYYVLRLFRVVGQSVSGFRAWRENRSRARTSQLTSRGLMYFQEGDYERAERFLESGARDNPNAAASFIYAARAANAQGKDEARENYLRQARESDPEAAQAVAVADAAMAIERQQFGAALRALDDARSSDEVTRLKAEALLGQQDWQRLAELMPALRKSQRNTEDLRSLQKRAALARLGASGVTDEGRAIIYKKLDDDTRRDPEVAVAYCNALSEETEAEAAIRAIVNKTWIPELVVRYGGLGRNTLARRIKTAESWQKQHQDDAALQLCLGELYEANGEKDKARTAYQRSVDLKDSSEASSNLGRMLAFEGDYKTSNEYLTRALKLGRGS